MPVNLYYTQRIRGFQQESVKYNGSSVRYSLKRTKFQCNHCGSPDVTAEPLGQRLVHGEPMGCCHEVIFEFTSYRLYCPRCKTRAVDHIPFLSHPWSRMTKALERTVLELRQQMSIRAVANYFHLRWHTVKELEKKHLKNKFSRIETAHVCGSPRKLDNLNRCKMACKLKQKGPFYEEVLREQIQEPCSA